MAGRGPQSYQKRKRELQRKEKREEKIIRRQQRKDEPQSETQDIENMEPLTEPQIFLE